MMLAGLGLRSKIMATFLFIGLAPLAVLGYVAVELSDQALSEQAYGRLVSVRENKKAEVETFLSDRRSDMASLMTTVQALTEAALDKLTLAQAIKRRQVESYFKERFGGIQVLADNHTVRSALDRFKEAFDDEEEIGGPAWKDVLTYYNPWFKKYIDQYGYGDLYLINDYGDILYTTTGNKDLGANLEIDDLKSSPLAKAYQKAKKGLAVQDFTPYEPLDGKLAAFVAAPVKTGDFLRGVVVVRLSPQVIADIVQDRSGMGQTGESYLIAEDGEKVVFRTALTTMGQGRYVNGFNISQLATEYMHLALDGGHGRGIFPDSAKRPNLIAYDALDILGLKWAMISKITMEEAIAPQIRGVEKDYFAQYIAEYGFHDLFLIAPDGTAFYTVAKESDYQTNLMNGEYADSGLGRLIREVTDTHKFGMVDFSPYVPSNNQPAAFMAQPVFNNGRMDLVVALQLSLKPINKIMQRRQGLGRTGETYLVGADGLMRSDSLLEPQHHTVRTSFADPVKGRVETAAAKAALRGKTGQVIIKGYQGNRVLSAYTPITFSGLNWALLAEVTEAEAFGLVERIKTSAELLILAASIVIILAAIFMTRHVARSLKSIFNGLRNFSVSELDQTRERFLEIVRGLDSGSAQVNIAGQRMAEGATEQAASLEETSASLEEIATMVQSNADKAAESNALSIRTESIMTRADGEMNELNLAMDRIGESGGKISRIVGSIDEIAFQTNLLALNAAVEAARAGEAGAGFAVVADEVRALALRSAEAAKSTQDLVADTVQRIKMGSDILKRTRQAFEEVSGVSSQANLLASEIASASKEQASGIDHLNKAVNQMDQVVQANAGSAEQLSAQAEEVNEMVQVMKQILTAANFKNT